MKLFPRRAVSTLLLGAILAVTLCARGTVAHAAARTEWTATNISTSAYGSVPTTVNGQKITAYAMHGTTVVGMRAFAVCAANANVVYDRATRTLTAQSKGLTVTATDRSHVLYANGRCLYSDTPITILSDGRMYVPVLTLARAYGLNVAWVEKTQSVRVTGTYSPILSGDRFYREDEVYWLSRIIAAESRGEVLLGQIAVGNVVCNRVRSREFPNTIWGVIFDRKYGVQFTPVANGTVYQTPPAISVLAAKIVLDGYTVSDRVLYFYEPAISTSKWIENNRPYAFTIGVHRFHE